MLGDARLFHAVNVCKWSSIGAPLQPILIIVHKTLMLYTHINRNLGSLFLVDNSRSGITPLLKQSYLYKSLPITILKLLDFRP